MKPSFALNLTEDGVTLLHRTSRGWMDVGSVAFADPDMAAGLEFLRSTALGLSPTGVTTKLIIPESQILYLQIDAIGPDDASRRAQIEAALDGRTPYALDELVYDWSGSGATVTVAVVARETLAEAEAFAAEHRFNPVSFVAAPDQNFDREPFFGPSSRATELLAANETVEADSEPVSIIARDLPRLADPIPAVADVAVEPEAPADEAPESVVPEAEVTGAEVTGAGVPEPVVPERTPPESFRPAVASPVPESLVAAPELPEAPTPPSPDPVVPDPIVPEPVVAAPVVPEPIVPEPVLPEPVLPEPVAPRPTPVLAEPDRTREREPEPEPVQQAVRIAPVAEAVDAPVTVAKPRSAPSAPDEAEAPMAVDVPHEDGDAPEQMPVRDAPRPLARTAAAAAPPAEEDDDLPPPLSSAALRAFSTRRGVEGVPRPLGAADPLVARPEQAPARPAAPAATRPTAAKPAVERPAGARPAPKFSYDDPLPPPPPRLPGDPATPPASVMGKAGKGLRSLGTLVTAPSIPGTRKKKPAPPATSPAAAPALVKPGAAASTLAPVTTLAAPLDSAGAKASVAAAAQSLARQKAASPDAIARGLSARTMPQRGKPRYLGLILTGLLLLLLALVAAWSSFYLTRADDAPSEVEIAGFDPTGDAEALADGQFLDGDEDGYSSLGELDDLPVNVDLADLAPAVTASAQAEPELADAEAVPMGSPEVASVVEPAASPTEPAPQTGVQAVAAVASQPDAAQQDEIFLAGMDAPPSLSDPLVLPSPAARGDAPPAAQMPPPPFGTVYQFDSDGRIVPTAEGIMTPEGVMLVAGKPARVPPPRPAAAQAPAATVTEPATLAVSETAASANGDPLPAETYAADPALSDARL